MPERKLLAAMCLLFGGATLIMIVLLCGIETVFEFGLLDGHIKERWRTRYENPMITIPCAERGCQDEIDKYHITLEAAGPMQAAPRR
jgi:hypothetical protein